VTGFQDTRVSARLTETEREHSRLVLLELAGITLALRIVLVIWKLHGLIHNWEMS
jgi:hypothetical protein